MKWFERKAKEPEERTFEFPELQDLTDDALAVELLVNSLVVLVAPKLADALAPAVLASIRDKAAEITTLDALQFAIQQSQRERLAS